MRFLVLILLSFFVAFPACAQDMVGDVRNFIWGVSKDDVKKFEKVILFEDVDNALFFIDDWDDVKILVGYEFQDDKLFRVSIDFQKPNYPDPAKAVEFYVTRELELDKTLGVKGQQETIWNDYYYANMPNHFPLAVLNGHVELVTKWQTPRSNVTMRMKAEDFNYTHRITYESRVLKEERQEAQKQEESPLLALPAPAE